MKSSKIASWVFRIIASVVLLQTLYFKFSAQPESVELFTKLGVEPYGRIGTGFIELIVCILLILPRTAFMGAIMGLGVISGALLSHLLVIGIETSGDGGQLFVLALIVFLSSIGVTWLERRQGVNLLKWLRGRKTTQL